MDHHELEAEEGGVHWRHSCARPTHSPTPTGVRVAIVGRFVYPKIEKWGRAPWRRRKIPVCRVWAVVPRSARTATFETHIPEATPISKAKSPRCKPVRHKLRVLGAENPSPPPMLTPRARISHDNGSSILTAHSRQREGQLPPVQPGVPLPRYFPSKDTHPIFGVLRTSNP